MVLLHAHITVACSYCSGSPHDAASICLVISGVIWTPCGWLKKFYSFNMAAVVNIVTSVALAEFFIMKLVKRYCTNDATAKIFPRISTRRYSRDSFPLQANCIIRYQNKHAYTCTRVCAHTHTQSHAYTHIHKHACTCTHMHIHIHICTHTCICIHTYTHALTYTHTYTHACTHIHIYAYTLTHTCTHTHTHAHTHTHTHTLLLITKHSYMDAIVKQ